MRNVMWIVCVLLISVFSNSNLLAQCTPLASSGQPGFTPQPDNIPCINRGEFFSEVLFIENVGSFNFGGFTGIGVDTLVIDSIVNLPCNMQWIANGGTNRFYKGETGCIRVFGTTNDTVGQYKLKVYIKAYITVIGLQQGEISEIIEGLEALVGPLGIDFSFFLRVKEPLNACPNIVPNDTTLNITAKRQCAVLGEIRATATTDTNVCLGDAVVLNVTTQNMVNPVYQWNEVGSLSDSTSPNPAASPSVATNYVVSVTDSNGTGNTVYDLVRVNVAPSVLSADFTEQVNGKTVGFTPVSNGSWSYTWNFGDGSSLVTKAPIHTYANGGSYDVTLITENICGTDTFTKTLTLVADTADTSTLVVNLPIASSIQLWPNPATDMLYVSAAGATINQIIITDLTGRAVAMQQVPSVNRAAIDVASLSTGVYLVRAIMQDGAVSSFEKLLITSR